MKHHQTGGARTRKLKGACRENHQASLQSRRRLSSTPGWGYQGPRTTSTPMDIGGDENVVPGADEGVRAL
eukprot:CAMPEP_0118906558 /NCGR_PEP_ID=MMETSP1166-20130328/10260_1 /TAXON_ID=1104430 /ORGANISM="Chrysoreinhardia sp, Strain CCMP3193" /LENGTH=69 /DNA_ID=CAMNT_0006845877 /DNA_START=45 /DNA_END=251 /DNA_ORIENTATION=-